MFDTISGDMERYYGHKASPLEFLIFFVHPRTQAVAFFRMSQWFERHGLRPLGHLLQTYNMIVWGCELSPKIEVGRGLRIEHTIGVGLAFASAGENLTVNMGVIVGGAEHDPDFDVDRRPRFGDNVTINLSSTVFGGITIGDNVIIGAHSLVNKSVPSNCVVAGCPARIIRHLSGFIPLSDPENYCKDVSKIN
jgi:serine O-acetyltransferase